MTLIRKPISSAGSVRYVKYADAVAGDILVTGIYQGFDLVPSFDKKKQVPLYTFVTEDEEIVKLNSAGRLDKEMVHAKPGMLLEVTFLGKEKFKNKEGSMFNAFQFNVLELKEVKE